MNNTNTIEDFILSDYYLNQFIDNENCSNELSNDEINKVWLSICGLVKKFTVNILNCDVDEKTDETIVERHYNIYQYDLFQLYLNFLGKFENFEKNLFNFIQKNIDVVLKSEDLNLVLKLFKNEEYIDYCLHKLKTEDIDFKILHTFFDMDNILFNYQSYFVKAEKILLKKFNEDNKKMFLDLMLETFLKYNSVKNDDIKPFLYLYDKDTALVGKNIEQILDNIDCLERDFLIDNEDSDYLDNENKLEKYNFIKENFNINVLSKILDDNDKIIYYKDYLSDIYSLKVILSVYDKEYIDKIIPIFIESKIFTDKKSLELFLDYYDYDFTNLSNARNIGEAFLTKINTEKIDKKIKIDINWNNLNSLLNIVLQDVNFNDFLNHLKKFDFYGKENLLENYIINYMDRDIVSEFLKEKIEINDANSENFSLIINMFKNENKSKNIKRCHIF